MRALVGVEMFAALAGLLGACVKLQPASVSEARSDSGVWSNDFSYSATDPQGDDTGAGGYLYPQAVTKGAADLRLFELAYAAARQEFVFTIGVTKATEHTRLGLMFQDPTAFASAEKDYAIGGVEFRVPFWNGHGVNFLLSLPAEESTLFDYSVKNPNPGDAPRADNIMFVAHAPGGGPSLWLGRDGSATTDPAQSFRVPVRLERGADFDRLVCTMPAALLKPYLDTQASQLHALLYSYLAVPGNAMEYGGFEVGTDQGGGAGWEDTDAYDLAFVNAGVEQASLMAQRGEGGDGVPFLNETGRGFAKISTAQP